MILSEQGMPEAEVAVRGIYEGMLVLLFIFKDDVTLQGVNKKIDPPQDRLRDRSFRALLYQARGAFGAEKNLSAEGINPDDPDAVVRIARDVRERLGENWAQQISKGSPPFGVGFLNVAKSVGMPEHIHRLCYGFMSSIAHPQAIESFLLDSKRRLDPQLGPIWKDVASSPDMAAYILIMAMKPVAESFELAAVVAEIDELATKVEAGIRGTAAEANPRDSDGT